MTAASALAARVAIIDGGGANIASLRFALERLGATAELTSDHGSIRAATHVILPGVGAARAAMDRLKERQLDTLIPELRQPLLGICLGLQLLFERSEEDAVDCLGILGGTVRRFPEAPGRPVPHMGWNQVTANRGTPLFANVPDGSHFYFVHSYAADVGAATIATTEYGRPFSAAVQSGNVLATQFHPERSGPLGARILANVLTRY